MTVQEIFKEYEEAQGKVESLEDELFEIAMKYVAAYNNLCSKENRIELHQTPGSEVYCYNGMFHFSWDDFYTGYDLHDYMSLELPIERLEEFYVDSECVKKHVEEDAKKLLKMKEKDKEDELKRKEAEYERLKKELGK